MTSLMPIIHDRSKRCHQYKAAIEQLMSDVFQGFGREGTTNYRDTGCYGDCGGYNEKCRYYYVPKSKLDFAEGEIWKGMR